MSTNKSTTAGQHSFARIPSVSIERSRFDRSHGLKTTFNAGDLIPIFIDEALPGDTFSLKSTHYARLATPIHPIMDNLYVDTFFFAVPNRLLWENWERFNGAQDNPADSTDFLVPEIDQGTGAAELSIDDYMGIPTKVADLKHSALWHRAYNLIYNEWFRDENLVDALPIHIDDGPDPKADYGLVKRGKRHDYFSSCLPFPQKGPSVLLPIGDSAPVTTSLDSSSTKVLPNISTGGNDGIPRFSIDGSSVNLRGGGAGTNAFYSGSPSNSDGAVWEETGMLVQFGSLQTATGTADLTAATATTINQIRQAFQVQRMFEKDARGGTRYTELVRAHFGVVSPDARLQRPEYLGGGSAPITISQVPQTSSTDLASPQGNLAAYGISAGTTNAFNKSFTEHCVILGLVSIRADLNYQQGLDRMWSRRTKYDFYWPSLAHLGEQAVLQKEIFADGDPLEDELVFGYQERYAEYRYKPSKITGLMRSNATQSLDTWHLAQDFGSAPVLNAAFIQEDPPVDRVLAVLNQPQMLFDAFFQLRCVRPMPTYSVPGLIDHF